MNKEHPKILQDYFVRRDAGIAKLKQFGGGQPLQKATRRGD